MKKGDKCLYKHPHLEEPVEAVVAYVEQDGWMILEMDSKGEVGWPATANGNVANYENVFQNSSFWSVSTKDKDILPYPAEPVVNNHYSII